MSRRSITASTIQSHSASKSRSSSVLPVVTSLAAFLLMKAAGSAFSSLATAPSAMTLRLAAPSGTISSSTTGMPALATWAAIPAPMTPAPMTATFWISAISHRLQDRGDALTAADALGGQRVFAARTLQKRSGLADDARTRGAQRVAERDGAAIDIDLRLVELQIADTGQRLGGEGFIEFDHVERGGGQAGALQRLCRGRDRADAHDLGGSAGDGHRLDAGQNVELVGAGIVFAGDQQGHGAIGQRRGSAGGDGAVLVEGQLEAGQPFGGGVGSDAEIGLDAADGDDLILQQAIGLRLGGAAMAFDGEGFLLGARNAPLLGDILGGLAHADISLGMLGGEFRMRHRVEAHHRDPAHALDEIGR